MGSELTRSGSWRDDAAPLLTKIREYERRIDSVNILFGGLKELDDYYELIAVRLDVALLLLNHPDSRDSAERVQTAAKQAREALMQTDSLNNANVSLDQKDIITDSAQMSVIREKLQQLVLLGGAGLFEAADTRQVLVRKVTSALRKALLKYSGTQHRLSGESKPHEYGAVQYEISEGKEEIVLSDRMVLPLSQAVLLIEDEILPALDKSLKKNPGDPALIARRNRLTGQLEDFKSAKFFPRARPHTIEKDLFTAALAGFTPEGEALVAVDVSTIQSSGNTYDHLLEHLRVEIIRDCLGSGVSRKLDEEIEKRHSPNAGRKYSLTDSLNSMDIQGMFQNLSMEYPFLRRIENREDLKLLADLAGNRKKTELGRLIDNMAKGDTNLLTAGKKKLQLSKNED